MGLFSGIVKTAGGFLSGGLGGGLSALGGYLGQQETNQMQMGLAKDQMQFQAEQAQINRDFQYNMSGTEIRRRVGDLMAAGLNPMLAYSDGASSPSGSAPTGGAMATVGNPTAAGMSAAAQSMQMQNAAATNKLIEAQTGETETRAITNLASAGQLDAVRDNIRQEMTNFDNRVRYLLSQTTASDAAADKDLSTAALNDYARQHLKPAELIKLQAEVEKLKNEARLLGLKVPEALQEAKFWTGPLGEVGMHYRHAAPGLDKLFTGTVTKGADMLNAATQNSAFKLKMSDDQARILKQYGATK